MGRLDRTGGEGGDATRGHFIATREATPTATACETMSLSSSAFCVVRAWFYRRAEQSRAEQIGWRGSRPDHGRTVGTPRDMCLTIPSPGPGPPVGGPAVPAPRLVSWQQTQGKGRERVEGQVQAKKRTRNARAAPAPAQRLRNFGLPAAAAPRRLAPPRASTFI